MSGKRKKNGKSTPEIAKMAVSRAAQFDLPGMSLMSLLQFGSSELIKEAILREIDGYLGRQWYQRPGAGDAFKGYRNGFQATTIDTPVGQVTYDRPKVTGAPDFRSQFHVPHMRRPEEFAAAITDMYVNGVSTRKVKGALKAVTGEKVRLSKSTVSRVTKRVRQEFATWKTRSLADLDVAYLFLDAIRVGMRIGGQGKDAILLAYAIMQDGHMELLSVDLGHSESDRSWGKFVSGLKVRGLKDPLLTCSDGNQAVINAIDANFQTGYRQRCLKHRTENILDAVPKDEQGPVTELLGQIFYGSTSLEQAKGYVKKFKREFTKRYPTAVERLQSDLNQCLTFYLFPSHHWRRIRTSNKLERVNLEIRRRLNVIGRHPDESGCLSLIYAVVKKYAKDQRGSKVDDVTRALWQKLRADKIAMLNQLELDLWAA
jgi:transposase-like protein